MPDTSVKLQDITPVKSTFDNDDQILLINPTGEARISKEDFLDAMPDVAITLIGDITTTGIEGDTVAKQLGALKNSKAPVITETTESSAIATFTDGADGMPIQSLVAEIEPIQDLTYGNPYPAGGGKNLLPNKTGQAGAAQLIIGGDATSLSSETGIYLTAGTYTIKVQTSKVPSIYLNNISAGTTTGIGSTEAARTVTISTNGYYFFHLYLSGGITAEDVEWFQLEAGSSFTGYAPYSNICPITGWTGCNVTRTGANVWDEEWEVGGLSTSTGAAEFDNAKIRSKNFCACKPRTTYCKVCVNPATYIWYYDIEKNFISFTTSATTFTTPDNCYYFKIRVGDLSHPQTTYNNDISINYPSTDTTYHAFTGNDSVSLSWQTEAGTVYGGTIDVATGLLTVTDGYIASYNGEALPSTWISDRDVYSSGTTPTTGAQVVYALTTPQTYQLTPQEVRTLLGTNNVWSDTGNVTVKYPADTKMYIDNAIAALA